MGMNLYATITYVCLLDRHRTWHFLGEVNPVATASWGSLLSGGGRRRWWEGDGLEGQGGLGGIPGYGPYNSEKVI